MLSPAKFAEIVAGNLDRISEDVWGDICDRGVLNRITCPVFADKVTETRGISPRIYVGGTFDEFKDSYARAIPLMRDTIAVAFGENLIDFMWKASTPVNVANTTLAGLRGVKRPKGYCALGSPRAVAIFSEDTEHAIYRKPLRATADGVLVPAMKIVTERDRMYTIYNDEHRDAPYDALIMVRPGAIGRRIPSDARSKPAHAMVGNYRSHYQVDGDLNVFGEYAWVLFGLYQDYVLTDPDSLGCYMIPRNL